MLLKSLVIIGAILGLTIGTIGMSIPWLFPQIFTHDPNVIQEVSSQILNFFKYIYYIFKQFVLMHNNHAVLTISNGRSYCLVPSSTKYILQKWDVITALYTQLPLDSVVR
jgi:hypothetical protein